MTTNLPGTSRRQFLIGLVGSGAVLTLGAQPGWSHPQPTATEFSQDLKSQLDEALDRAWERGRAPGLIAGVWQGSEGSWTALRGVSKLDGTHPPQKAMHTRVGSITKTMVGTLILQLVDEGRLSLDQTVDRWFPRLPQGDEITVEMLGQMSSGIASYTFHQSFTDAYFANPTQTWSEDTLLEIAFEAPRQFDPGRGFQYCNTNFVMLGQIVEKLRGLSLGEALKRHLFEPLKMAHSSYPADTELPTPYWHGCTLQGTAEGADQPVDATHWSPTFGAGAGQAVSDLHDLALWAKALGTGQTLRPETHQRRLQPNPYSEKGQRYYAFGVGCESGWIGHAGTLPGYNTQVSYLPQKDLSVVVMANSDIETDRGLPAVDVFRELAAVLSPEHKP